MQTNDFLALAAYCGIDVKEPEKVTDQAWISCPLAPWTHASGTDRNPSCGVRLNEVPTKYHCFSCNASGTLKDLFWRFYQYTKHAEARRIALMLAESDMPTLDILLDRLPDIGAQIPVKELPTNAPASLLDEFDDLSSSLIAVHYVKSRRVSDDAIEKSLLKYDPEKNMIVFPCFDFDFVYLRAAVGRLASFREKGHYNYFNLPTKFSLGGEHLINPNSDFVVLVEGLFDLLVGLSAGCLDERFSFVASWTSSVTDYQLSRLQQIGKPVFCAFDPKSGDAGYKRFVERNRDSVPLSRLFLPENSDIGSLSPEAVLHFLREKIK